MNTKQVIVMRKDLNMRKGKMIAQGSHASMAFLTKGGGIYITQTFGKAEILYSKKEFKNDTIKFNDFYEEIRHWLTNSFRKIVCYVNSLEELLAVEKKALDAGLMVHTIEDNGATEFNGQKTVTCLAVGPHFDEKFVGVTDHLPLL